MGAPASVALPKDVLSGSIVDISVNMVAPSAEGTYTGYWKLKTSNGTVFGSGDKSVAIWVKIIVENVLFAVTKVDISIDNAPSSTTCTSSNSFEFSAKITVTAPGKVTYSWQFPDSSITPGSVNFTGPATKSIHTIWVPSGTTTSGSVSVYIDDPNHQEFGSGGSFTCIP
jgi:hypothetical protein